MAKRTRASARYSAKKKALPSRPRRSTSTQTEKAVDARRYKFTPELIARARYLFEETGATFADIAFELRVPKSTVFDLANRKGWKRYVPPPRDVLPATKILLQAEALERRQQQESDSESAEGAPLQADLIRRLRQAVQNELAALESVRERLKREPKGRGAAEGTARTLATLTETLHKLQRLQSATPDNGLEDDTPADIDEFRKDLARRIREFVASRTERGAADGAATQTLDSVR